MMTMMRRTRRRVLCHLVWIVATAACATTPTPPPPPASADAAFHDLKLAVHDRRRDNLWQVLDRRTRDTWQVAWRARQASHQLIPLLEHEQVANDLDLRTLPKTPPARAEDLFDSSVADPDWARLADLLDPAVRLIEFGSDAEVLTPGGDRFVFRKGTDDAWGFTGFAELARQAAQHELLLLDRLARLVELQTPGLTPGSMPWN
jgi:hypothetical protein